MDADKRKGPAENLRERAVDLCERAEDFWDGRVQPAGEDAAWFLREKVLWPAEDRFDGLGRRERIGLFGGGAVALSAVVAALVVATTGGGSASSTGTTEALVVRHAPAPVTKTVPAATPAHEPKPAKAVGPTLHGAPPHFAPAKEVTASVGDGDGVEGGEPRTETAPTGDAPAPRGLAAGNGTSEHGGSSGASPSAAGDAKTATASGDEATVATAIDGGATGAGNTPASTARIGSTPAASESAQAEADSLPTKSAGVGLAEKGTGGDGVALAGPVAPKAAKRTARRFAEAFVVYEVGGVDSTVRGSFYRTTTKQLSRALLQRPPRQPAGAKVPQAKVVNVVAGPSKGGVYPVSVSLLRVGVTSELRLELERDVGKKWQVTDVLG